MMTKCKLHKQNFVFKTVLNACLRRCLSRMRTTFKLQAYSSFCEVLNNFVQF